MSYHNIPSSTKQSIVNAQGETAPPGYHYMPDGTLMSDIEHTRLYDSNKVIRGFDCNLSDIQESGETRMFSITGDNNAEFYLEIKNASGYYYNFTCSEFQSTYTRLDGVIENGSYSGGIVFPRVFDVNQYDIYLYAKPGTKHVDLEERKFKDNSIDYNNSIGSNSILLKKVIYQILDVTLTLASLSPTSAITLGGSTNDTIELGRYRSDSQSFSLTANVTSNAISVDRQPTENDLLTYISPVVGSAPLLIPGESIYSSSYASTDTVNGAVSTGGSAPYTVTMDTAVASKVKVGDRIGGNSALIAATVTVVALTGTYTFTMSEDIAILDGLPLYFYNRLNYQWPVNNVNKLSEDMIVVPITDKILTSTTLSKYEDIITIDACTENEKEIIREERPAIDKSQTLPTVVKGITTIQAGNITFNQQQPLALAGTTINVGGYGLKLIKELTDWDIEINNLKLELNTITTTTTADTTASASTTIAVASTVGIAEPTTQTVNMSARSTSILKYGLENVTTELDSVDGLNVGQRLRAMSVGTLSGSPIITKINKASKLVTFSVEQTFADGETLTFSNSKVSGIGIDASVEDPYITSISSLNLTSSVAQALESGQTLTFGGSGNTATITGDIIIKKAGPLDLPLYFDVEKFLTYHS